MPAHPRIVAARTSPELADRIGRDSVLLLPVGATEQHGAHLPVSTDTVITTRLLEQLVEEAGAELDAWLLPALEFGKSTEHLGTAGTLSLSTSTLLAILDDIAASVAGWPATKLVLVNGHGGNTPVLEAACRDLRIRHGLMVSLLRPMAALAPPEALTAHGHPEVHGGAIETSLMLHLAPELVHLERATASPTTLPDGFEHVRFGGTVAFGWSISDVSDNGVVGDPTRADADAGAQMVDDAVGRLRSQIEEIGRFAFARDTGREPRP